MVRMRSPVRFRQVAYLVHFNVFIKPVKKPTNVVKSMFVGFFVLSECFLENIRMHNGTERNQRLFEKYSVIQKVYMSLQYSGWLINSFIICKIENGIFSISLYSSKVL